jgi:integrase
MRGQVRQRGKRWAVVYDEGYGEDGKRRQRWKSGFRTKSEAEAFLTKTLGQIDDGGYVEPSKITLGHWLTDEWLPAIERRASTVATYESLVRRHIIPKLGQRRLQALSPAHVNAFYKELRDAGLSAETRRLIHSVLLKACGDALKSDKIMRNPIERVDRPAGSQQRAKVWTAKELGRFLAHVEDDRLFALWRLAATTGMRRGELLGLTWREVDVAGGSLAVTQQLLPTGEFGPPKSKRSERTIRLDADTVAALKRHRDNQRLERALAGDAYTDGDLVFCDELGGIIQPSRLSDRFLSHRKAAKVNTGTMHTLRHTAATLLLTNAVPLHVVAARLGDRPETILKTYAHLLPNSDEQAAVGMAELLEAAR